MRLSEGVALAALGVATVAQLIHVRRRKALQTKLIANKQWPQKRADFLDVWFARASDASWRGASLILNFHANTCSTTSPCPPLSS